MYQYPNDPNQMRLEDQNYNLKIKVAKLEKLVKLEQLKSKKIIERLIERLIAMNSEKDSPESEPSDC